MRAERQSKFNTAFADPLGVSAEDHTRQGKIAVSKVLGYYAPAIRALNPIFVDMEEARPGVKMTMGVDKYYRMYVSRSFVLEQVQAARDVSPSKPCGICGLTSHHPLAYIAGIIGHEASHLIRRHSKRYESSGFGQPNKWNIAADMELNDDLIEIYKNVPRPRLCLPPFIVYPQKYREIPANAKGWTSNSAQLQAQYAALDSAGDTKKIQEFWDSLTPEQATQLWSYKQVEAHGDEIWPLFGDGKIAEEYYMLLPQNPPCPVHGEPCETCGVPHPGGHGDGDSEEGGGDSEEGDGHSHSNSGASCTCPHNTEHGSGVGGESRDHELGPPSADNPGVSEAEAKIISREVAKNICKSRNRGTTPAGMQRWADEELEAPKYDWRAELNKAVRYGAGRKHGSSRRSFRRLSILTGSTHGKILYPSKYDPVPNITVVQDTSGSMDQNALNASAAEITGICTAVGAKIRFTSVDAEASKLQDVTNVRDLKLTGGGGTDMRVGIKAALSDPKCVPSVIIVLTDGYTPWPDIPPNNGETTLIVCLVGEGTAPLESVPTWALGIKIEGENPEVREAV